MSTSNPGNSASPAQLAQAALEQFRVDVATVVGLGLKSKAAAIRQLQPALDNLSKLGFSQEKIVEVMKDAGLEMTVPVLKSMLWRQRNKDGAAAE